MKKAVIYTVGMILLLPIFVFEALGIDLDSFRDEVLRPENLPAGTAAIDAPAESKIVTILQFATNLVLYASGAIAVLFLVIGGIRYITSYGNQERSEGAKKTIKYAIIGLLAVILAFAIVTNVIDLVFKATV